MAMDRVEVVVHTMNFFHYGGPVFYASLPRGPRDSVNPKGDGTNGEETKHRLVFTLWDHLRTRESPLWKHCQSSWRAALQIQSIGPLGRPQLLVGEYEGPAVSFSECGGNVWAALCGDESDIGIDVAGTDEFQREYPFRRVFHPAELQLALRLTDGDLGNASALLWSVKEAVVKALGCAFHLVDPRQITIYPSTEGAAKENVGYIFPVRLSGKALMRFSADTGRSLWVCSLPQGKRWLSIALLNRRPSAHE